MRIRAIIPFIPYIIVSVVHCVLIAFQLPGRGYETKQLLMPALALASVWSLWNLRPFPRTALVVILGAITASWIGDGAGLFFPGLPDLPMMLLFFGLAHIAYIVLFWRAPGMQPVKRVPKWAVIYIAWWIVLVAIVGPAAGSLFVPVAIYGIVLGATAALSPRLGGVAALGGAFFLISDSVLAFRLFLDIPRIIGDLLIMPTYTLGQGLIVFGAVALLRSRVSESQASIKQLPLAAQSLPR